MKTFEWDTLPISGDNARHDCDLSICDILMTTMTTLREMITMMKTFEWDPLPISSDNAGLFKHICCCASDLVPVTGQVLMMMMRMVMVVMMNMTMMMMSMLQIRMMIC